MLMLTPGLLLFFFLVVTGARLYFYDHSFVNEDTSKVFLPPECS